MQAGGQTVPQENRVAPEGGDAAEDTRPAQAWKLVLAYDGTDFHGWQVQPGLRTVQGELCRAIHAVTGESVLPQGSGRTDTGVHAEAQAVSLGLRAPIAPERLLTALNRRLPAAIRVLQAAISPGFHARSGVVSKTYEYRIVPGRGEQVVLPWHSRFVWECRVPVSLPAMQAAAGLVVGTHDFTSFAACDPDRSARLHGNSAAVSNVRTILTSSWSTADGLLRYRVTGTGFLHHMVRNLVGTFLEVGCGRRTAAWVADVLHARDRRAAGATAPPQGLFLMDVVYRDSSPETTFAAKEPALCRTGRGALP